MKQKNLDQDENRTFNGRHCLPCHNLSYQAGCTHTASGGIIGHANKTADGNWPQNS